MTQDLIRYDLLAQEALRGVVRTVLADVAKNGLPGDHHFFIGFSTTAPGVRVSNRLRESYPEEMTVVLQHQFWDLEVTDTGFSISLSFNGVPERLVVPFSAIKGFLDPSVQFGLQFDAGTPTEANDSGRPEAQDVPSDDGAPDEATAKPASGRKRPARAKVPADDHAEVADGDTASPEQTDPASGAEVVSLDKFRKKN
ncbi:SspB family protein [Microbaculum marinum]|uniref:SspB family protein n=1 Tax=Microbaculum marinum TaxID=1764581 RepID=A0AAW9RL67_9HYPH